MIGKVDFGDFIMVMWKGVLSNVTKNWLTLKKIHHIIVRSRAGH